MKKAIPLLLGAALLVLAAVGTPTAAAGQAAPEPDELTAEDGAALPLEALEAEAPPETAEPSPSMNADQADAMLRAEDALCGAAYLGHSDRRLNVSAPAMLATGGYNWRYPFLGEASSTQMVETNGDQVFVILPRRDVKVEVYTAHYTAGNAYTIGPGALLATSTGGQPVILRCNTGDVMPNTLLLVQGPNGGVTRFFPWASLSDGSVICPDRSILDLTITDFSAEE